MDNNDETSSFERIYGAFYTRRYGPDWRNHHVCGVNGYVCGYCSGRMTHKSSRDANELAEAQRHQEQLNEQEEVSDLQ